MGHGKVMIIIGGENREWCLFRDPVHILSAWSAHEVLPTLQRVEDAVKRGFHAAGFLTYEASPGLDGAYRTQSLRRLPLVWFGLFRKIEDFQVSGETLCDSFRVGDWKPSISSQEYKTAVARIKRYLESGDTYQVNYTFRLKTTFEGNPLDLFLRLHRRQRAKYSAFIDTNDFAICSVSPELFLFLDGDRLVSCPMKGTSKRGLTIEQDRELADRLRRSAKDRAENVMIVDMVRNDMGRIAEPGSVHAASLFDIERYPTVFQMISTVTCRSSASFVDIVRALFPCASITGAPKVRTMQVIKELERGSRGVYTGCVGYLSPGRRAQFNVAIRTVSVDKRKGILEYGVGGGIVWDSDAENEYEECQVKAGILMSQAREFKLLESMLWEKGKGYFLLDSHLKRLVRSAEYFDFTLDLREVKSRLTQTALTLGLEKCKIRLCVTRDGGILIDAAQISDSTVKRMWRLGLVETPVDSQNPFLYHKTTNRAVYENALSTEKGCDDVLLWNERGEVTETTIANVVIERCGERVTPPVECGLLPGVFRQWLRDHGEIRENVVRLEDLQHADRIHAINSVRTWIPAEIAGKELT